RAVSAEVVALIALDTSLRSLNVEREADNWDFGVMLEFILMLHKRSGRIGICTIMLSKNCQNSKVKISLNLIHQKHLFVVIQWVGMVFTIYLKNHDKYKKRTTYVLSRPGTPFEPVITAAVSR
ncbi:hypothetical protein QQP08_016791, partial [Theobroma cacao]